MSQEERKRRVEKDAKELATKLSDFVNYTSRSEFNAFVEAFAREHRTLQQAGTKLMMTWLKHCASDDYGRDGRNEATHQLAKEIEQKLEFPMESYLPLI